MPKAKTGAKKTAPKKPAKPSVGLLKSASRGVAKAAAKLAKVAAKVKEPAKAKEPAKVKEPVKAKEPAKAAAPVAAGKAPKAAKVPAAAKAPKTKAEKAPAKPAGMTLSPFDVKPDKPLPRASKLPAPGEALTKREMEQLLTAGQGRGVAGEGSLKGKLLVKDGFPYLQVVGRDKRELTFLLQGPDQEVLPAYLDHKVSVSGLIRKMTNYGGIVDVRKYAAKKPDTDASEAPPVEAEHKLKYLSPGEVEQITNPGMGAGMKGFAAIRGNLEMTGEDFFLVVSHGGTRHQVSFTLQGKGAKGLRKFVGQTLQVTGVIDKQSGWGGFIDVENVEPRSTEFKAISRDNLEVVSIEGSGEGSTVDVKMNGGLSVRLTERAGFTWAIEPTAAKRMSLREANFEPSSNGPATREFFFTPRNPGMFEVEFFLAKAGVPGQVSKTYKLVVNVKAA